MCCVPCVRSSCVWLLWMARGATCVLAWLMYRYWWGLEKAYEYLLVKKPDLNPRQHFMRQLFLLDKRLR